eukprot:8461955-Heterocapsa_arctica.AAC.1
MLQAAAFGAGKLCSTLCRRLLGAWRAGPGPRGKTPAERAGRERSHVGRRPRGLLSRPAAQPGS